jgi:penicillin-insensitive murein DD-endopeptidase
VSLVKDEVANTFMMWFRNLLFVVLVALLSPASASESTCFGTVSFGRLKGGIKLPKSGKNYTAYSTAGWIAGRTYVHSKVHQTILTTYEVLAKSLPDKTFVYGETGSATGGLFRPHKTHQNGLSVDFMVPVVDKTGRSVALPGNALNKFGYEIEFDKNGQYKDYVIDYETMAEHLYQLKLAADQQKVGIALTIFDLVLLPKLLQTKRGEFLKSNLKFMKGKPWIRHDEHYHVDFAVPCKKVEAERQ